MVTLPGFIDIHVHLRDPGQTEKEDFFTGTSAAIAGGFTTVFDMPNNKTPITTSERLGEKSGRAKVQVISDIGFYFGSLGDNLEEFTKVASKVWGIKLYLNVTTGHFLIDDITLEKIYDAWKNPSPVLVHSEEEKVDMVLKVVAKTKKQTHFCHVSSEYELSKIIEGKNKGLPVTCGVCPHHLFLTENDVRSLKSYAIMKPPLKTERDKEYLWKHLDAIDVIESDHAPHTTEEKKSDSPPFGVPGLETTLPLLFTAEHENKITREQIMKMCFENPQKILHYKANPGNKIDVDTSTPYTLNPTTFHSKCKWSPFDGWKVRGRVVRTFLHGKKVFEDGRVLIKSGEGTVITPAGQGV